MSDQRRRCHHEVGIFRGFALVVKGDQNGI